MELIRRHSHELFSRQEAKKLLDRVAIENPRIVEDLVPKLLPLAVVHKVFQNLLRERVSIRDSVTVLEAVGEAALTTKNVVLISEYVRHAIRRTIVERFLSASNTLPAFFLDPKIEEAVARVVEHGEHSSHASLPPQTVREIASKTSATIGTPGSPVVVVTGAGVRFFLQQLLEAAIPNLYFLSHNDIPPGTKVVSLGVIQ
jgi:flagellar biosynthesis protein FlhA